MSREDIIDMYEREIFDDQPEEIKEPIYCAQCGDEIEDADEVYCEHCKNY